MIAHRAETPLPHHRRGNGQINTEVIPVDVNEILKGLREEREQLEEAIIALGRLQAGGGKKRRGRPPAWLAAIKRDAPKRRGRPPKSGSQ